jgi:hypothetical protein
MPLRGSVWVSRPFVPGRMALGLFRVDDFAAMDDTIRRSEAY